MPERRIAAWRSPSPSEQGPLVNSLYFAGYGSGVGFITVSLPVAYGLIPIFSSAAGVFDSSISAGAFIVAVGVAGCLNAARATRNRVQPWFSRPLAQVDHRDGLSRMGAIIQFETEGHLYGLDRGEFTLVDDWLVFEGGATSFAISAGDVLEPKAMGRRNRSEAHLRLIGVGLDITLIIRPLNMFQDPGDFLSSWFTSSVHDSAISVLPPLRGMPGPQGSRLSTSNRLLRVSLPFISVYLALITALILSQGPPFEGVLIFIAWCGASITGVVVLIATWMGFVRRRALNRLGMIERGYPQLATTEAIFCSREIRFLYHEEL